VQAGAVFLGAWLSGYFIIVTNAWMQNPVAFERAPDGVFHVTSFWALLLNPWALIQFAHTMSGALITGAFVMAGVGAYYLLEGKHLEDGKAFLRVAVPVGVFACIVQIMPTGHVHAQLLAAKQPPATAAMEGLFESERGAGVVILGQPDPETQRIDNPLVASKMLSLLLYGHTAAEVKGLNEFPRDQWPTNIPLLFFSYHIMAGLGTIFVAVMGLSALLLWRKQLFTTRWLLWVIMLCVPLPYIANTAGWMTAELGRQPWLVYGLMRTVDGPSRTVHAGNSLFTLLGFMGLYTLLSILFIVLIWKIIAAGPGDDAHAGAGSHAPATTATTATT
jgi:cytochrome d ubiquinol oxidase subunit I